MKYTKQERLDIGRRIYNGEISRFKAAEEYDVGEGTARDYLRLYKAENHLPDKRNIRRFGSISKAIDGSSQLDCYELMTKEALIHELVQAKITEARLKKGYEVKGDGVQKEYIPIGNKSTK